MGILFGTLVKAKAKTETRDMVAASGNVEYTGYDFKPKIITIFAVDTTNGAAASWGSASASPGGCTLVDYDGVFNQSPALVRIQTASGTYQAASFYEFTNDGYILTWVKGGSPTGIINLKVTATG